MLAGQRPQGVVVAGVRQDDPDVGHRRLGEDAGDVALRQRPVERFDVVPLDRLRRFRHVNRRADVVGARAGLAVDLDRERLVDGAVVAPGVDEDLRPAGDRPGEPDHGAVGVGGGQRELPVGKAEAAAQLLADPARVLGREHQGDPRGSPGRRSPRRLRRANARSSRRCRPGRSRRSSLPSTSVKWAPGARREHRVRRRPTPSSTASARRPGATASPARTAPCERGCCSTKRSSSARRSPREPLAIHRFRHVASICRLRRRFTGR